MNRFPVIAALLAVCIGACSPTPAPPSPIADSPVAPSVPATSAAVPSPGLQTQTPASALGPVADAAAFPDPGGFAWRQVVAGLKSPVDIQFTDDSTGRIFIVEQVGRIRVVENGQLVADPFLDISDRVESGGNEQGLLGLAFHPQFRDNGIFFVNYTDRDKHDVIARFRVSNDSRQADAGSEVQLISQADPFPNHNGGVLVFGPDGFLYAGLGDGGGADDVLGNGQNVNTLLGKVLRLDVDHGDPYAIPRDNPFVAGGGQPEIWAYGLRNPWRISFDRANGDLYIADVGQDTWEEVDFWPGGSPGGANFGWNYREGFHHFAGTPPVSLHLTSPVAEYSHAEGGCSVTGGYVYRGQLPEWRGIYLYGDYCSGKIWGLLHPPSNNAGTAWPSRVLFQTKASITTFGQDPGGKLYFADRAGGIYQLQKSP